ncbi:hypothetical protein ACFX59_08255 [Sphingomonas sp. NCPPB 2930]|uniref:hypothetical protein n=1 Tax=Sphingomonas sp. NCPPB 2930 TaxID=3162788 RepID=UPI0036D988F7
MTQFRFRKTARPLLALGLMSAGLLGGCSRDTGAYPSLAVRPVEKRGFAEPEVETPEARPNPALDAQIAQLAGRLDGIQDEFAKAYDQARASAAKARGQTVGSDAWLTAQTDLAALDEIRARTSGLLTEIDDRAIARAAALEADYPALTALRTRAVEANTRQGEQIKALSASLPAG